jgi:hypothetical protein
MNPADEFLKHAADCQQMAKLSRDAQSKATWNRMAQRWMDCAARFKQSQAARTAPRRHRRPVADREAA